MDDLERSFFNHEQRMIETSRRQARQAANMSDAAEATLLQAQRAVEDFSEELAYFESHVLLPEEEIRIVVIGGPSGTMIFPDAVSPQGHDRVRYEGRDDHGARVTVIQHVTQFNIMLKAVKVVAPARRIGFIMEEGNHD